MYLTRFRFNTARMGARRLLVSPQKVHAAVLHGFPDPDEQRRDGERLLWRVDRDSRHSAVLYLASPDEPDLTHLVEQAGWPARGVADGWETRPYDKLLSALETGQRWAFRLTANPVRYTRPASGEPKRRLPHVTPEQQLQWLLDRCEQRGFSIPAKDDGEPNILVHDRSWLRFTKEAERKVTIRTATFDGVLEVEDPTELRRAMVGGIGKAKAYGCGMLTLAPISGSRR